MQHLNLVENGNVIPFPIDRVKTQQFIGEAAILPFVAKADKKTELARTQENTANRWLAAAKNLTIFSDALGEKYNHATSEIVAHVLDVEDILLEVTNPTSRLTVPQYFVHNKHGFEETTSMESKVSHYYTSIVMARDAYQMICLESNPGVFFKKYPTDLSDNKHFVRLMHNFAYSAEETCSVAFPKKGKRTALGVFAQKISEHLEVIRIYKPQKPAS